MNLGTGLGSASSQTVCGKANEVTCSASALVEGLAVQVASNVLLKASLLSSCVTCGTGSSQVAGLKLVVDLGLLGKVDVTLAVAAGCSSRVAIPTTGYSLTVNAILATVNSTVSIFANEQACSGGTLTVNALRVSVLGVANVVVAQSKSGAPGCGCTACGTSPGCTPPAAKLC
ncbi:MAG: hypothetical protein ACRD0D_11385 [Acidimicrobiales bacterium]